MTDTEGLKSKQIYVVSYNIISNKCFLDDILGSRRQPSHKQRTFPHQYNFLVIRFIVFVLSEAHNFIF